MLRDHFRNEAKKCSKSSQNTCILLSNVEQSRVIDHVKITRLKPSQPLFEPNIPNELFLKYQTQPQLSPFRAKLCLLTGRWNFLKLKFVIWSKFSFETWLGFSFELYPEELFGSVEDLSSEHSGIFRFGLSVSRFTSSRI